MSNYIIIYENENFDKLFTTKNYDDIKTIHIFGQRNYDKQTIEQIIKFKQLERLRIHKLNKDEIDEFDEWIANLQSLVDLLVISKSHKAIYISKNKKNMIINCSLSSKRHEIQQQIKTNIKNINNVKNITMFVYAMDDVKILCDELLVDCTNVRIIIKRLLSNDVKNLLNFKVSNLPTTIKKINVHIDKKDLQTINNIGFEDILRRQVKIPFDCELNIFYYNIVCF